MTLLEKILSPFSPITRKVALTSSFGRLNSEECRKVTLQNDGNGLEFKINLGDEFVAVDQSLIDIEVSKTDKIQVKGSGTLYYIVHK